MRSLLRALPLCSLAALAALASCDPLPHVASGVCGNHVIEPGEDCDGADIAPGTCDAACRLECGASSACPAGWGCGTDGICRQPLGTFTALGNGLPISADRLTLADFDGDGKRDVLATRGTSLSVAYLDEHGLLPESTTLSLSPIDAFVDAPGVGDVDGDGRADLALRVGNDLGVLRGRTDRTLLADAFTRDPGLGVMPGDALVALDVDTRIEAPGDEILAYGNGSLRVVRTLGQMPGGPLYTWPAGMSLSRPPALVQTGFGRVLLLSLDGDDHVTLLPPVVPDPGATPPGSQLTWNVESGGAWVVAPPKITLPSGATVNGGAFVYPIANAYDLLIHGKLAGQDQYFASFYGSFYPAGGTGYTQGYHASPYQGCGSTCTGCCTGQPSGGAADAATLLDVTGDLQPSEAPLLAGPLATGVTGVATVQGLYALACPPNSACYTPVDTASPPDPTLGFRQIFKKTLGPASGAWTAFLPFGAGVVTTGSAPGFTYYRAEAGAWNPFQIPTQGAITNLVAGDFNGDGAGDLLFTQVSSRAPSSDPTLQSLHASFGDPYGVPGAVTDLGDVGHVSWLLSERDPSTNDGISDCLAHTTSGSTPFYLFSGSTDRQLESPLVLLSGGCSGPPVGVARYSAIGRFSGGAGADIATLYRIGDSAPYTYEIHSIVPSSNDSAALCKAAPASVALPDPGSDELTLLPVDLRGDGTDELLVFPKGGSKLFVASVSGGKWSLQTVDLGAEYLGITTAALGAGPAADKHLADVVLWSATGVTVLWNDGKGALDPGSAALIAVDPRVCGGSDSTPRGVAAINLAGDAARQLLVVTTSDTVVVRFLDTSTGSASAVAVSCASSQTGGGGDAVTTGDVNGDGVEDLVVARPGGLQVFTGKPVLQ